MPASGRVVAPPAAASDLRASPPSTGKARAGSRRGWRHSWAIAGLVLVAGMATGAYLLAQTPGPDHAGAESSGLYMPVGPSAPEGPPASVTVRPPPAPATGAGIEATRRFVRFDASTGKYGYADESGRMVIEPQFASAGQFVDGLAPVLFDGTSGPSGYGYIDTSGTLVIEPRFRKASAFSGGLARVEVAVNDVYRFGFIDHTGTMVIEPLYEAAWSFSQERARVGVSDLSGPIRYGFIDQTGAVVISPRFESARDFAEGLAAVAVSRDGVQKWGYIDRAGSWVIEPRFSYALSFLPTGLAPVELEGTGAAATDEAVAAEGYLDLHLSFIDKTGRVISDSPTGLGG